MLLAYFKIWENNPSFVIKNWFLFEEEGTIVFWPQKSDRIPSSKFSDNQYCWESVLDLSPFT